MTARRCTMRVAALAAALALPVVGCGARAPRNNGAENGNYERDPFADEERPAPPLADPWRGMNRSFFRFNDRLYFWVLKPVASGHARLVPQAARVSLDNLFANLAMPRRVLSALLQGDLARSGHELARFGINTTVGLLGLFDPARNWFGLKPFEADFGHTFAAWGMKSGIYICWPLLGPSCGRDSLALPLNMATDPMTFLPGGGLIKRINYASLHLDDYEDFIRASVDPYIAMSDAYNQYRHEEIKRRGR